MFRRGVDVVIMILFCLVSVLSFSSYSYALLDGNEPNDSMDAATELKGAGSYKGYIDTENDVDWYRVEVVDGSLEVKLVKPEGAKFPCCMKFYLALYDEYGDRVEEKGLYVSSYDSVVIKRTVESGVYYFKVYASDEFWSDKPYTLVLGGSALGGRDLDSYEPNDGVAQATVLNAPGKYKGYIETENDVDYYKIRVGDTGLVKITLSAPEDISGWDSFCIEILSKDSERIDRKCYSFNDRVGSITISGSDQVYFLKVYFEDGIWSEKPYTLFVEGDVLPVEEEADCSLQNLDLCTNEKDCESVGGFWYDSRCHREPMSDDTNDTGDSGGDLQVTPGEVSLSVGDKGQVLISGGVKPYRVVSSNLSVAEASLEEDLLLIEARGEGEATIVVEDAVGNMAKVKVHVNGSGGGVDEPPEGVECVKGKPCLYFKVLKCNGSEENCTESEFFRVGDHCRVVLCSYVEQESRFEAVDLYVAILLPDGTILFSVANPFTPFVPYTGGSIFPDRYAYKRNLIDYKACYVILDFEVIPGISGTYELFAAYGYSGEILDVFSLYSNVAHEKMVLSE